MNRHSQFVLSPADGRPMYLQIMAQIRQRVAVGEMPPGTEMPSIRQLAMDLRISVITVKRAYLELEREGVIATQQGKGSVVAASPTPDLSRWREELKLHLGEAVKVAVLLGMNDTVLSELLSKTYQDFNKDQT